jgi:hypothetical protein
MTPHHLVDWDMTLGLGNILNSIDILNSINLYFIKYFYFLKDLLVNGIEHKKCNVEEIIQYQTNPSGNFTSATYCHVTLT